MKPDSMCPQRYSLAFLPLRVVATMFFFLNCLESCLKDDMHGKIGSPLYNTQPLLLFTDVPKRRSCLEDEMNGKHERMKLVARQSQLLSSITELAVSLRRPPQDVVPALFLRLDVSRRLRWCACFFLLLDGGGLLSLFCFSAFVLRCLPKVLEGEKVARIDAMWESSALSYGPPVQQRLMSFLFPSAIQYASSILACISLHK